MSTATLGHKGFRPSIASTLRSWPDADFMIEQAMGWTVAQVPWWAVSLLGEPSGLVLGTPEWRVRERMQQGRRPFTARSRDWWCAWYRVVVMARELEERTDLARWRNRAWSELDHTDLFDKGGGVTHAVRGAALHSIRAFAQFIDLRDDEGQVFEFEDFHVQTVRAMRCYPEPSVILLPFGHGKLIAKTQKCVTPLGLREHGELRVGDEVYGPDGKPTRVIGVSADDWATLRVTFSDGESIDCHPRHEWRVYERGRGAWRVMETQEIARRKFLSSGRPLFQVEYCEPLQGVERELPMDPYALGVWLGDGTQETSLIAHHPDDVYELPYPLQREYIQENTGVSYSRYGVEMRTALREAEVYTDKHIPEKYQLASARQRWDLLSGLIDTDGSVDPGRGRVRFINTNPRLVEGVVRLVRSFGMRPSVSVVQPQMSTSGIRGRRPVYYVSFSPRHLGYPSRLVRKSGSPEIDDRWRKRHRGIVSIEPIDPVVGNCIQVERPDGMYLVGETLIPTHNSALNSLVVPLMDWAEFPDASEGRIYWSNSHHRKWTGRLMQVVEGNEALHQLFPWVNKPIKGDPCYGIWSGDGFSIKGRRTRDRSFEPLTASTYSTGNRYHRIGNDDWVQTGNATSIPTQDRLFEYLRSGPLTMPMPVRRGSRYGTAWSKVYHCGTLFDPNDVNYRAWQHFKAQGWRCVRFDIYPHEDSREKGEVLWPTKRPFSYVQDLEQQLGRRVFDMRCRNRVALGGKYIFTPQDVDAAMTDSLAFGRAPAGATLMIGFDPASSKKGRRLAHPALVVYGEKTETSPIGQRPVLLQDGMRPMVTTTTHHVVEWHRLTGSSMPEQCQALIDVARRQQAPVAVEDNQTQIAYAELIRVMAPDVRVITHTTTENRRDPLQGVDQFQPLFENRSIFIHTGGAERPHINELRSELVHWPRSRTTDLVMAMWIARFQLRLHEEIYRTRSVRSPALPGYAHFGGRRTLRLVKPA